MSAISEYIHYHYNYQVVDQPKESTPEANAEYLANQYAKNKIQMQYNMSLQFFSEKLRALYNVGLTGANARGEEEFFNILKDLETNALPKAAKKMAKELQMPDVSIPDIIVISQSVDKTQALLDRFKVIAKQITQGEFSKNPIPVLTHTLINQSEGNNIADKARQAYRDAYLADGTTFKVDASYKGAVGRHNKQINNILANLSGLQNLLNGDMSPKSGFTAEQKSQTIRGLLISTFAMINRIIGYVSEDVLADALADYLKAYLPKAGIKNLTVKADGTGSSSIYKKKTEDVSISMDFTKMLTEKQKGLIQVTLPGVSVKRTNINKQGQAHINIKNSTVLGKMLNNSNMSVPLQQFYQAYATYNMSIRDRKDSRAQLNRSAKDAMAQMYDYIHAAILPTALAGSLTSGDFATFLVVNDRVYNMAQMIEKLGEDDDYGYIKSDLEEKQTGVKNQHNKIFGGYPDPSQRWNRSADIKKVIRDLNITVQLYINLVKAGTSIK